MSKADADNAPDLPHDEEAEQYSLSVTLQWPDGNAEILRPIVPLMYSKDNKTIGRAILRVLDAGGKVDVVTVGNEIGDALKADELLAHFKVVHGRMLLVPRNQSIREWADIIRSKSRRRDLMRRGSQLVQWAGNGKSDEDIDLLLRDLTEEVGQAPDAAIEVPRFEAATDVLARPMPRPVVAIEGLLHEREVLSMSGPAGGGKGWLAMSLSVSLSTGLNVFGAWNVARPYRVAMLDLEDGGEFLDARLHRVAAGWGLPGADLAGLLLLRERMRLDNPRHMKALLRLVAQEGIEFLVVDTLRRAFQGDENASSDLNRVFTEGLDPLKAAGCGSILLDHTRKLTGDRALDDPAEALRGSTDKRALVDVHVGIEPREERRAWIPTKSRHMRLQPACLLDVAGLDSDDPESAVTVRVLGGLDRASDRVQDAIVATLEERGPTLRGDILEHLAHYSDRTVTDGLGALVRRRVMKSTKEGKQARYSLLQGGRAQRAQSSAHEESEP